MQLVFAGASGRAWVLLAILLAVLCAAPWLAGDYLLTVLITILYLAYVGQAWNVMMGFAGQLSLGHAIYVGLGAYAAAVLYVNFGIARDYDGVCHLRFDDTNPEKEDTEYVDSIIDNVRWLGFDWEGRLFYASDYFEQLYDWAVQLIVAGKAYVCDLSAEEIRRYRGSLTEPGTDSTVARAYRSRKRIGAHLPKRCSSRSSVAGSRSSR